MGANKAMLPPSEDGAREVVACLLRNCVNREHAEAVITRLLDTVPRMQSLTAEIAAIARETRGLFAGQAERGPEPCDACRPLGGNYAMRDGETRRCECARGRWLAGRGRG